jgi:hypothetical protein
MMLDEWAKFWGISQDALNNLKRMLGVLIPMMEESYGGESESAIQQRRRLNHGYKTGGRLWRNNVGVLPDESGRPIRYGLVNESAKINKTIKSSDLIGITPHLVTPDDVGKVIGIFTAEEVKEGDWKFSGTEREMAQLNFLLIVVSMGGLAKFTKGGEE